MCGEREEKKERKKSLSYYHGQMSLADVAEVLQKNPILRQIYDISLFVAIFFCLEKSKEPNGGQVLSCIRQCKTL